MRPLCSTHQRQRGFTLLEIMIAIGILAIVMTAGLKAIEQHNNNLAHLKLHTLAHWVAQNQVAEVQLKNLSQDWPAAATSQEGTVEMAGVEWKWTLAGKQTKELNTDQLYEVEISIALAEAPEQVLSQQRTLLVKRL